jgi:hypothetical protein
MFRQPCRVTSAACREVVATVMLKVWAVEYAVERNTTRSYIAHRLSDEGRRS